MEPPRAIAQTTETQVTETQVTQVVPRQSAAATKAEAVGDSSADDAVDIAPVQHQVEHPNSPTRLVTRDEEDTVWV